MKLSTRFSFSLHCRPTLRRYKCSHLRTAVSLISISLDGTPLRVNHRSQEKFIYQVSIPSALHKYHAKDSPWISKYLRGSPHFGRSLKAFGISSLTDDIDRALSDSLDVLARKESREMTMTLADEISRMDGFHARLLIARNLYSWLRAQEQVGNSFMVIFG